MLLPDNVISLYVGKGRMERQSLSSHLELELLGDSFKVRHGPERVSGRSHSRGAAGRRTGAGPGSDVTPGVKSPALCLKSV